MTTVLAAITIALVAQLPQVDPSTGQAERVLRSVSLRHLIGVASDFAEAPRIGSLLEQQEERVSLLDRDEHRFSADEVAGRIDEYVDRHMPDVEFDCYASEPDGQIDLIGPPRVVDAMVDLLAAAEEIVTAPIEVEVVLYRVDGGESVLARLPVRMRQEALLAMPGLARLWRAQARCRSSQLLSFGHSRETPYVRSLGPEVAEESVAMHPSVRLGFDGISLALECHGMPGSTKVAVLGHAVIGHLRQGERPVRFSVHGEIDFPVVESHAASFSGIAASGDALLLSFRTAELDDLDFVLAVSVVRKQVREDVGDGMSIYPHTALTSRSLAQSVRSEPSEQELGSPRMFFPLELTDGREVAISVERMTEFLRASVGAEAFDEGRVALSSMGGFVVVDGPKTDRDLIAAALRGMHERRLRTGAFELEMVLGATVRSAAEDGVFGVNDGSDGAESSPEWQHRVSVPVLFDRPHYVLHGVESTSISGIYINIATKSAVLAPVVTPTFDGILASFESGRALDGSRTATTTVDLVRTDRPVVRENIGSPGDSVMLLATTQRSRFSHDGRVRGPEFVPLGEAGIVAGADGARRLKSRFRILGLD